MLPGGDPVSQGSLLLNEQKFQSQSCHRSKGLLMRYQQRHRDHRDVFE